MVLIWTRDIHGLVPLHYAIYHTRSIALVKLLLASGASMNIKCPSSGCMPMEMILQHKNISMLKNILSVKTEF